MGRTDSVAHDPSVADYRATSPRKSAGRNMMGPLALLLPLDLLGPAIRALSVE
jgi:hypothetical protein